MFNVRPIATACGALVFFIMAIVSYFASCQPDTCCTRGIIGAVITYVVVSVALNIINNICIDAIIDSQHDSFKRVNNAGTDNNR